jgi:HSP20 family molecular chaperone IbpA
MDFYFNAINYSIEENDRVIIYHYPIPGVDAKDIIIKVKNTKFTVDIPTSEFMHARGFCTPLSFKITKDSVKVWVENGVLFVEVTKPEDYEFEIKL